MKVISTKNSVIQFAGGQAGPPFFPSEMNLAPLTNGKNLGLGWDDISTGLSFVLSPRRMSDDGFKGARLILIYPAVDKRKIVGGFDLHLLSGNADNSRDKIYRVKYEDYLTNASWNSRRDLDDLKRIIDLFGGDHAFFEHCLSMAAACHTVLLKVEVNKHGQDVLVVHNDADTIEFRRS